MRLAKIIEITQKNIKSFREFNSAAGESVSRHITLHIDGASLTLDETVGFICNTVADASIGIGSF